MSETTGNYIFNSGGVMKLSQPIQQDIRALSGALLFQPKINGIRAYYDGDTLRTRNGRAITCCQHITDDIKRAGLSHLPLDGELYADNIPFDTLNGMIRRKKPGPDHVKIYYCVFDLIDGARQADRLRDLETLPDLATVKRVRTEKGDAGALYRAFLSAGFEGLIARDPGAAYGAGVYKVKPIFDSEFRVVKADSNGAVFKTESGETFRIERYDHGLKPGDLATIEYNRLSENGVPIHGRLKSGRYDISDPPTKRPPGGRTVRIRPEKTAGGGFILAALVFTLQGLLFVPLVIITATFALISPRK